MTTATTWPATLRLAAADIKLSHSVFALPFAVLGAFMARPEGSPGARFLSQLALIVVCMVFARTWAMLFNRLVDRRYDAANQRTARRALASGALTPARVWGLAIAAATLFVGATALFLLFGNFWPLALSLPVLAWIAFYSLTKRFTWLCHFFLGAALAVSPLAAALAVGPAELGNPSLWCLAGMVLLWVAGFDVIYALADIEFDRRMDLSSIPARLGWHRAVWISRALHAAAFGLLVAAWAADPRFGGLFAAGVGLVGLLLLAEHAVLARRGSAGLDVAFFTMNGLVSCALGLAGCVDLSL